MDLNEGVDAPSLDLPELTLVPQVYGFAMVHDRVFVTWFETNQTDDYQFLAEPKAVELEGEQLQMFHDLLNHQNDKMQALLASFIEGDSLADCDDPTQEADVS